MVSQIKSSQFIQPDFPNFEVMLVGSLWWTQYSEIMQLIAKTHIFSLDELGQHILKSVLLVIQWMRRKSWWRIFLLPLIVARKVWMIP